MYFKGIITLSDLKTEYKNLCKKHHPDLGGELETMKDVNIEYETMLKKIVNKDENFSKNVEIEKELMQVINKIIFLEGLVIDVCGRWIWVTGNTINNKKVLKESGFFWAKKKLAWYWRSKKDICKSKKRLSLESIGKKYGKITVATKTRFLTA